jgi:hypothetical protein
MIRLFNNVWLTRCKSDYDSTISADNLLGKNSDAFWQTLLFQEKSIKINCSEEQFVTIFRDFFSNILKDNSKENLTNLFELYFLNLSLNNEKSNLEKYVDIFQTDYNKISCLEELSIDNLGYEFLLPNFLLSGLGKTKLLEYVKFCCWSLLSQELQMYATDMKRDIFNAHYITGTDLEFSTSRLSDIPKKMLDHNDWYFILGYDFDHNNVNVEHALRKLFPDYKEMIKIFNNHAIAHRDAAGVDSYLEPVSLIYAEQYEELLYRDLGNDCRITYLSDSLGKNAICTFVSKVYWAYKHSDNPNAIYKMFEVR